MPDSSLSVKFFNSLDGGAPTLSGAPGAMITLLKACLLHGFNSKPCNKVEAIGNEIKLFIGDGHGFKFPDIILLSLFSPDDINKEFRVKSSGSDWIIVESDIPIAASQSSYVKRAPAGWLSQTIANNKEAFFIQNDGYFASAVWVFDDTNTVSNWNSALFQKTKIDTYDSIDGGGVVSGKWGGNDLWFIKSRSDTASTGGMVAGAARPWTIIADSKFVYLLVDVRGSSAGDTPVLQKDGFGYDIFAFGHAVPVRAGTMASMPSISGHCFSATQYAYARSGFFNAGLGVGQKSNYIRSRPTIQPDEGGVVASSWPVGLMSGIGLVGSETFEAYAYVPAHYSVNSKVISRAPGLSAVSAGSVDMNGWGGFKFISDKMVAHRVAMGSPSSSVWNATLLGTCVFDVIGPWR